MDDLTPGDYMTEVWLGRMTVMCSLKARVIEAGDNRLMLIPLKD